MASVPVSKTKIIPPRRRTELLVRKRLLDTLFDALDSKLVLVSAPAGYGKTSLLIDVALQSEYQCCWLSLDELDRDPQRFLAYLVTSIAERFPGVGHQTLAVMDTVNSFEEDMERLAVSLVNETFASIHEHFVLILDDFHILEAAQPIYNFLNRFIQLVDENCHVIVSSRTLTTLADLPLMVAREQVSGLSFSDLAFHIEELQALFLQNHNIHISDEEAQRLIDETEGWITGLQFSGNSIARKDSTKPLLTGAGLFDYLGQQVVDKQQPHILEFLLRTSLMEEFDAALCEAVLSPFYAEKQDWQAFIQAILKNNLFAIPVGVDGRSLRYHHLFRDYLRQRMEKEKAEEIRPILERLSRAYESMREWEKAHAVVQKLGDVDLLVELIDQASFNNLHSTARLVDIWLRDLPPSVLKNHARILSITGTLKLIKGDVQAGIAELTRAIEAFHKDEDVPQLALALTRRSYGHRYLGDYQSSIDDADEAIRLIENSDNFQDLHAEALHVKGNCMMRSGQNRSALRYLENALDVLIHLELKRDIPYILTDIGLIHQSFGNYSEAERNYMQALNIHKQDANLWAQAGLLNSIGYMFHKEGKYEKAAFAYEDGLICSRRIQHTRMEILIYIGLGDLYAELQDVEIADLNYQHAEQMLAESTDLFLIFSLQLGRANLALLQQDFSATEKWIRDLKKLIRSSKSHYENGHFNLLAGKFHMSTGKITAATREFERAETHFFENGLDLDLLSARVWFVAAYAAGKRQEAAVAKAREVLEHKAKHVILVEIQKNAAWFAGLQKDETVGRALHELFIRADKFYTHLPDVRRELRRQARVVEVPAAHLIIKGFGNAKVLLDGQELSLSDWQTQSVRDLFFFFLSQNKPLTKEQVAEVFWRELDDPARIRQRFKNEMYRLRRAVGNEAIIFESPIYIFNRKINYEYDVEAFESHLARARATQNTNEQIELYRAAVEQVTGPYLNDTYFDWVVADREKLDQMYLTALLTLAELYKSQAQLDEALTMCQRAVEYQPFYETAYQLAMQVHHRMRNRTAILQTYEACKSALRKHLNMPPSPETEALYRKLIS